MMDQLWLFSLKFYDDARVQAACIALQDAHGGDINVVLCLLWHASHGAILSDADVVTIDAAVQQWRIDVVQPMRAIRRILKTAELIPDAAEQQAFRNKVKALELAAEKLEQGTLSELVPVSIEHDTPHGAARRNLAAYGRILTDPIENEIVDILTARVAAISLT